MQVFLVVVELSMVLKYELPDLGKYGLIHIIARMEMLQSGLKKASKLAELGGRLMSNTGSNVPLVTGPSVPRLAYFTN